jgi:8-oxo-dGTP pyrophosphatase MutT (NUDIX family)
MTTEKRVIPPYYYIVNVEAAIFKEKKWLMIKRSEKEEYAGGTISFVGGKVDVTKEEVNVLEKTLRREIWEEVGVEIEEQMTYVKSSLFIANDEPVVDIIFLCQYKKGTPHCKSPDEVAMIYWMTTEEIINHPNTPPWLTQNIKIAEKTRERKFNR